jgi:flagellar FliL protein
MPEELKEVESAPAPADQEAELERTPVVKSEMTQLLTRVGVIAVVAMVAVVAAYFVTVKVLKPMMATDPNAVQEQVEAAPENEPEPGGHEEAGNNNEEVLFEVDQIIVNPASTVGSRFLSCSVAFELKNPEYLGRFESREIKIRDALITILSSRTVDELADARLREPLRRQILARINKLTEPAEAEAVYFKDFVLQ